MDFNDLQLLADVYNSLLTIETKGENTITIAKCLVSLKNFIESKAKKLQEDKDNKEEE